MPEITNSISNDTSPMGEQVN